MTWTSNEWMVGVSITLKTVRLTAPPGTVNLRYRMLQSESNTLVQQGRNEAGQLVLSDYRLQITENGPKRGARERSQPRLHGLSGWL
jgi:hypothetical protein